MALAAFLSTALGAPLPTPVGGLVSSNLPPVPPPLPDVTFPLLRIFGALALVLVLFIAGSWLIRHWQGLAGTRSGRPARLRLLEARGLGGRHALYVVAYDQQRLLIASSPTGISLIDRLPSATATEDPTAPEPPPSFAEALRRLLPTR